MQCPKCQEIMRVERTEPIMELTEEIGYMVHLLCTAMVGGKPCGTKAIHYNPEVAKHWLR